MRCGPVLVVLPGPQPSNSERCGMNRFADSTDSQDINVLALVKGCERYIFLYSDKHRAEAQRQCGRFAANPDLSFSWYDAAQVSQKIRQAAA